MAVAHIKKCDVFQLVKPRRVIKLAASGLKGSKNV